MIPRLALIAFTLIVVMMVTPDAVSAMEQTDRRLTNTRMHMMMMKPVSAMTGA